jgi:hypothetical protein
MTLAVNSGVHELAQSIVQRTTFITSTGTYLINFVSLLVVGLPVQHVQGHRGTLLT